MSPTSAPRLRLLGPILVSRGSEPVTLPKSQKTRALLAYLAVTRRPQLRDRLCAMFWDATDDPRAGLRWSLSKLRVLDDPGVRRVVADRTGVAFDPQGAFIDALVVRDALAGGAHALPTERLRELSSLYGGGFLEGLELPDFEQFQSWRVAERERYRSLHLQLLRELLLRAGDEPEQALTPARELVRLAPDDASARATLVRLLAATGRREEAEEHYHLGLRQLEKTGADADALRQAFRDSRRIQATPAPASFPQRGEPQPWRQQVRFCTAPDGVRLAFATLGQGRCLVKTANWMSHLEFDWKSPLWRHLARELSGEFRLLRYDQRGNGLSDWEVEDFSLDACVADLTSVVDAAGIERFPLLGISQGCRIAIAFAARFPERVSHLILYGGAARGFKHRNRGAREARAGLQALIREGWGRDNPAFRQVFTTLFMPGASAEQAAWFNELQRVSSSPENAARLTEAAGDWDVTGELERVGAPTLVMHATGDAMVPFEEARILAAGIAGARFVALQSDNHLLLDDEPAFARFLAETRDFLAFERRPE